jgi:hypothetical protein
MYPSFSSAAMATISAFFSKVDTTTLHKPTAEPVAGSQNASSGSLLGTGLIEITALTTLIGSSTAEQLTLGDRGAVGLAWAGMSIFGSFSVLKACLGAAMPGWLRETVGVRNSAIDNAVGLSLNLAAIYGDKASRVRKNIGEAAGVVVSKQDVVCIFMLHSYGFAEMATNYQRLIPLDLE